MIVHLPVIDLLIGNQDLESLNVSLASYADGLFYLDEIIGSLRAQYEYILIDTMPVFGTLVRAAMIAADQIIIPIMPEYYSVEGMQRLLSEIASVRKRFNPKLELCGLLPTRVDIRLKNEHQRFLRQLYQTYHNECVIFEYIPNSTDLSQSSQGMDMYESAAKSEAVKAYQSCLKRIAAKDRTRKEIYDWLTQNTQLDIKQINEIVEKLEERDLINDLRYTKNQVYNLKLLMQGKNKISRTLRKKGIPYEMIESVFAVGSLLPSNRLRRGHVIRPFTFLW